MTRGARSDRDGRIHTAPRVPRTDRRGARGTCRPPDRLERLPVPDPPREGVVRPASVAVRHLGRRAVRPAAVEARVRCGAIAVARRLAASGRRRDTRIAVPAAGG